MRVFSVFTLLVATLVSRAAAAGSSVFITSAVERAKTDHRPDTALKCQDPGAKGALDRLVALDVDQLERIDVPDGRNGLDTIPMRLIFRDHIGSVPVTPNGIYTCTND
ncbi:hypothetical protein BG005_009871 [Podila minutissima]|nr:hypothetical protein BG005_009871 [Podila minutissima]